MEETVRKVSAIFDKMASVKITPTSNYSVPEYWMNRAIKGDEKCKDNLFNWISLSLNIDKSILNAVFNAKYNKTNENKVMNRKLIRLTENDLHKIVKESVNRILLEQDEQEYIERQYAKALNSYSFKRYCEDNNIRLKRLSKKNAVKLFWEFIENEVQMWQKQYGL